jgi:hypothetical protein
MNLIEGIRQGQPVGALLGYLFERALHDNHLDQYIDHFRRVFPLVANKETPPNPGDSAETVVARNVVDGLGKYFVIEELVTEPRLGLDVPSDVPLGTWDNLSWGHFGLAESIGQYLDDGNLDQSPAHRDGLTWSDNASSATRAAITLQKPVRIAIHARRMLPEQPNTPGASPGGGPDK